MAGEFEKYYNAAEVARKKAEVAKNVIVIDDDGISDAAEHLDAVSKEMLEKFRKADEEVKRIEAEFEHACIERDAHKSVAVLVHFIPTRTSETKKLLFGNDEIDLSVEIPAERWMTALAEVQQKSMEQVLKEQEAPVIGPTSPVVISDNDSEDEEDEEDEEHDGQRFSGF